MLKGLGLICVAAAGLLLGLYMAAGLHRRTKSLELVQRLFGHMEEQMRYTAPPIDELLKQTAAEESFRSLAFLQQAAAACERGAHAHAAWREALLDKGGESGLAQTDREVLLHFGEGLGRSDLEGQLAHCRLCAEQLESRLAEARREAAAKARMYVTLGAAGGLAAVLLLL